MNKNICKIDTPNIIKKVCCFILASLERKFREYYVTSFQNLMSR